MIDNDLRRRFRWFLPRCGFVDGKRTEAALFLARAEQKAEELGLACVWEEDEPADYQDDNGEWHTAPAEQAWCGLRIGPYVAERPCLASLGGIMGADDDYRRIVEAELAWEALAHPDLKIFLDIVRS